MRPGDSLKGYMNHFQNQFIRVHNCSDDVAALAFINGPQTGHTLHKHLLKYNAMQMKEVHTRAQQYIQLEEAIKGFSNPPSKYNNESKRSFDFDNQSRRQDSDKRFAPPNSSWSVFHAYRTKEFFTPLKLPIKEVFQAIKNEPWVKRLSPIQSDPSRPGAKEYCSFHDVMGHMTDQCRSLRRYLESLIRLGYLKDFVLNPGAILDKDSQQLHKSSKLPSSPNHHASSTRRSIKISL